MVHSVSLAKPADMLEMHSLTMGRQISQGHHLIEAPLVFAPPLGLRDSILHTTPGGVA